MHAAALLADDELGKHRRHPGMLRRVSDPLLVVVVPRRVDDKLLRRRVVRRCHLQITDVQAVALFGHRKASGKGERPGIRQILPLLLLRPQRPDATPEQPELYAELDGQTEVVVGDGLERRNELLAVVLPSRVLRKGQRPDALIGEELRPVKNDLPHLARRRFGVWIDERGVAEQRSDAVAERREASIEGRFEASHYINADDRLLASLAFRARPFHHQLAHGFVPDDAQRLLYLGQRALRLLGRSGHIGQAGDCAPKLSQRFLRGMRDIAPTP